MRTYHVTIEGKTPLIMHQDNIEWSDRMERWQLDPKNRAASKAGDDRTPPYRWLGALYHDGTRVAFPQENIMRSIMDGGALVFTGGKNGKTFKSQTQSGMVPREMFWPVLVGGKDVPIAPFFDRYEERSFDAFQALAAQHGFMLYVKSVRVGTNKHIRVRPRLDEWTVSGTVVVKDEMLTESTLPQILAQAGEYKGLGEWRPGGKTPGPFGMFTAKVERAG